MNSENKAKKESRLILWMAVCCVAGLICTFIPWGREDRFHGQGFPFAAVMWDKPEGRSIFIDYPNPLAFLLNPLAFCLSGAVIGVTWWLIGRIAKRKNRGSIQQLDGATNEHQ